MKTKLACCLLIPAIFLLVSGCGQNSDNLPLPESAKSVSSNTINVPFPYGTQSGEKWLLNRDTSNKFEVQVINNGKVVATFPVDEQSNNTITLSGKQYTVKNITVNSDNTSGFVTLVNQGN